MKLRDALVLILLVTLTIAVMDVLYITRKLDQPRTVDMTIDAPDGEGPDDDSSQHGYPNTRT